MKQALTVEQALEVLQAARVEHTRAKVEQALANEALKKRAKLCKKNGGHHFSNSDLPHRRVRCEVCDTPAPYEWEDW